MDEYSQQEYLQIVDAYRSLFPTCSEELRRYWFPDQNKSWARLTSEFHSDLSYGEFKEFGNEFLNVRGDAEAISQLLSQHRVGLSIGLNPWADYLLLEHCGKKRGRGVVLIVMHNWYPLVRKGKEPINTPLFKDNPRESAKYARVFTPFSRMDGPTPLFVNIFPHFLEAGADARSGVSANQRQTVGGRRHWGRGFLAMIQDIKAEILGVVGFGAVVWDVLSWQFPELPCCSLSTIVKQAGKSTKASDLPRFQVNKRDIPFLPCFHPDSREMSVFKDHEDRWKDYQRLATTLSSC
jgi:hypothetical protein